MYKAILISIAGMILFTSCRSTRQIKTVIPPVDTTRISNEVKVFTKNDTTAFINSVYRKLEDTYIDFKTFSAKVDVDFQDGDGKNTNVTAHLRMQKDSVIWIMITGLFGIEGVRAIITEDSVHILNKQEKTYSARSVAYLAEVTALPLDLSSLQDLLIGNPVFFDSTDMVSYTQSGNTVSLGAMGMFFKNLLSVDTTSMQLESIKLDDIDEQRSRTCYLNYGSYESKEGRPFSTRRRITVTEKKTLDIKLAFKQYAFNETLSFPFTIPKNYKSN